MQPAVVTLPLQEFSDAEVTMLANFITLTPGTLSLDVIDGVAPNGHDGNRLLRIHAMHAGSSQPAIDHFTRGLYEQYARRVQEVMR
jgi:multicomponent Na+:H+ antiporter subunit E